MIWIHEVLFAIGPEEASGILYFHVFTGCDVVSAFHEKGKKSAWLTWDAFEEVSETFTILSNCPTEVCDAALQKLHLLSPCTTDQVHQLVWMRQG